jgi:hypothetical protein
MNVLDDQSCVISDYYSEQIKTAHLYLGGKQSTTTNSSAFAGRSEIPAAAAAAARVPGRVTIAAVKSQIYTSNEITVDNYHGSLVYANTAFFESKGAFGILQTGAAEVNITVLGNAFNGSSPAEYGAHVFGWWGS